MDQALNDFKAAFGNVVRYKQGRVQLNGEFCLYIQIRDESETSQYFFMNCEYRRAHIHVFTRKEITGEDFERAMQL